MYRCIILSIHLAIHTILSHFCWLQPWTTLYPSIQKLVGGLNHLEKYEIVNGWWIIPYMKWKIKAMFETGFNPSEKNEVSWDDYSHILWKNMKVSWEG